MTAQEWLEWLTGRTGASGHEADLAEALEALVDEWVDECRLDRSGNLILVRRGTGDGPRVLFAAHMDQVALWVKEILPGGFLRFHAPSVDPRVLPGLPVKIREFAGVVGMIPPHLQRPGDQRNVLAVDDLAIDIGEREEVVRSAVRVGDPVAFGYQGEMLGRAKFTAPGLDNRASVASALLALESLQTSSFWPDLYVVLSVQEEVGCWGAQAASEALRPDVALAVDVTFGRSEDSTAGETLPLGGGPAIGRGPNCHPGLEHFLLKVARSARIPHQVEPMNGSSGTDAWVMQTTGTGVRTGTVSIPLLHMHAPTEVVATDDVRWTARLLAESVRRLDEDAYQEVVTW